MFCPELITAALSAVDCPEAVSQQLRSLPRERLSERFHKAWDVAFRESLLQQAMAEGRENLRSVPIHVALETLGMALITVQAGELEGLKPRPGAGDKVTKDLVIELKEFEGTRVGKLFPINRRG